VEAGVEVEDENLDTGTEVGIESDKKWVLFGCLRLNVNNYNE
jgi:hypothetical protein